MMRCPMLCEGGLRRDEVRIKLFLAHTKPNLKPVDLNQRGPMSDVPSNSVFFQLQLNCPLEGKTESVNLGSQDLVYSKTVV